MTAPCQTITTTEYAKLMGLTRNDLRKPLQDGTLRHIRTGTAGDIRICRHQISYDIQGAPGDAYDLPEWVPLPVVADILGLSVFSVRKMLRNYPNQYQISLGERNQPLINRASLYDVLGGPVYWWEPIANLLSKIEATSLAQRVETEGVQAVVTQTDEDRPEFRKTIGGIVQSVIARQLINFAEQNGFRYEPPEKYGKRLREARELLIAAANRIGYGGVVSNSGFEASRALTEVKRAISILDEELTGKPGYRPAVETEPPAAIAKQPAGNLRVDLNLRPFPFGSGRFG